MAMWMCMYACHSMLHVFHLCLAVMFDSIPLTMSPSNTAFTLNFLTWAHQHSFSRFILLIEDRMAYDALPDDVDVPMVVISRDVVIPKQRITRDGISTCIYIMFHHICVM